MKIPLVQARVFWVPWWDVDHHAYGCPIQVTVHTRRWVLMVRPFNGFAQGGDVRGRTDFHGYVHGHTGSYDGSGAAVRVHSARVVAARPQAQAVRVFLGCKAMDQECEPGLIPLFSLWYAKMILKEDP